jgi:rRNA maturation endonuclease Nob1
MGIFRKMGRNVEEFAQSVKESADESAGYRCVDCDEGFHVNRETCPECGGDLEVVEPEPNDSTTE